MPDGRVQRVDRLHERRHDQPLSPRRSLICHHCRSAAGMPGTVPGSAGRGKEVVEGEPGRTVSWTTGSQVPIRVSALHPSRHVSRCLAPALHTSRTLRRQRWTFRRTRAGGNTVVPALDREALRGGPAKVTVSGGIADSPDPSSWERAELPQRCRVCRVRGARPGRHTGGGMPRTTGSGRANRSVMVLGPSRTLERQREGL